MTRNAGQLGLWRNRDFLLLWGGQTVSVVGSTVSGIVIPLFAASTLHISTFDMGLLAAASAVPFMLIGLPAGAIVDRFARRRLMMWCDCARAVVLVTLPIALLFGRPALGQLLAVALGIGLLTVFFDVAYQSYLPSLIERQQLTDGNGKLATTESLAESVGPGIAGTLVSLLGSAGAIVMDVVTYAVSAVAIAAIKTEDETPDKASTFRISGLYREIRQGLSYIAGNPVLRSMAAFAVTANLFGAAYNALEVVFLYRDLHANATMIGIASTLGSTGGVLGGMAAAPLGRRIGSARAVWLPLLALGWLPLLVPLAQPGWGFLLVGMGTAGNVASIVIYAIGAVSYRQAVSPPHLLNRITASQRWLSWCTLPAGSVLGGLLGTVAGLRGGVLISVAGCFLSGLWMFFSPIRRIRDLPVDQVGASEPDAEQTGAEHAPAPANGHAAVGE